MQLTPAEQFFYEHAGYSHGANETAEQGRIRCARSLAAAEQRYLDAHRDLGACIVWEDDPDGARFWERSRRDGSATIDKFDACEQAYILDASGLCLASLSGILDADDSYRRVVRAELAAEAFPL